MTTRLSPSGIEWCFSENLVFARFIPLFFRPFVMVIPLTFVLLLLNRRLKKEHLIWLCAVLLGGSNSPIADCF
jgi:glycopeptide antibiotics resistance protein